MPEHGRFVFNDGCWHIPLSVPWRGTKGSQLAEPSLPVSRGARGGRGESPLPTRAPGCIPTAGRAGCHRLAVNRIRAQGGSRGGCLSQPRVSLPEEESAHCRACERETPAAVVQSWMKHGRRGQAARLSPGPSCLSPQGWPLELLCAVLKWKSLLKEVCMGL